MILSLFWFNKTLVTCTVGCLVLAACVAQSGSGTPAEAPVAPTAVTVPTKAVLNTQAETPAAETSTAMATVTPVPEEASADASSPLPTTEASGPNTTPAASNTVPFEIVAQEAALVGQGTSPITLAIRGDDLNRAIPDLLPDTAKEALQDALARSEAALYIVVYAGQQPSSGYQVNIDSMTTDGEKLVVNYSLERPPPDQGGANVLTHPFVIARVSDTNTQPADVLFNKP